MIARAPLTRALLVTIVSVALARPAAATPTPKPASASSPAVKQSAEQLLARAVKAFDGADFQGCRDLLLAARKLAADKKLRSQVFLYLGLSHAVLGATAAAKKAFAAALTHDASLSLDPRKFKRDLVSLFNSVRGQLTGEVSVSVREPRALVYIDGVKRGPAPLQAKLPVGSHRVEVRSADGSRTFSSKTIVVTPYQQARVIATLPRGSLALRSVPSGAEVQIDGRFVGRTPLKTRVTPGTHDVSFHLPGYPRQVRQVRVEAGAQQQLELKLSHGASGATTTKRLWTWIAAGSAVAALSVGLALKLSANADFGDWERSCRSGGNIGLCSDLEASIETRDTAAYALFGVGAALVGATVAAFFLERGPKTERVAESPRKSPRKVVVPLIGPTFAGARVHF